MKKFYILTLLILVGCENSQNIPAAPVNLDNLRQEAVEIVRLGLDDANPHVRINAVEVVASTKQVDLMPIVAQLLSDEIMPVQFGAILAAGDLRYADAASRVEELLSDNNPNIRLAAAYCLWRIQNRSYGKLFENALTDRDQTVRSNAALILGKIGKTADLPKLKLVLRDPQSTDKTMFVAVEAIAKLGDESVYAKLWAMLISAYADDRVCGVRAMGELGTVPARNALITMRDDQVVEVRLAAAQQLGSLGDTAGEPQVLDFFNGKKVSAAERTNRATALAALAIGSIKTQQLINSCPIY